MWGSPYFADWLEERGLEWTSQLSGQLAVRALDEPPPPRDDFRREDGARLRDFVKRAARLPPRVRMVASLCLDQGLSLSACAERLSISRETVRVHLRRLRGFQRRAAARAEARERIEAAEAAWWPGGGSGG